MILDAAFTMECVSLIVVGFFGLVVLPPALMAGAHLYAVSFQDNHAWYLVVLDARASSVNAVAVDQARRYKMKLGQSWDSPAAKGYSAFVSNRQLKRLRADRRVLFVELRDEADARRELIGGAGPLH